ncbi:MAG: HAMP domain-containing histidine kinase [Bacteroidia bacterium]|nr:HAMP domain-containing histidine kinase [Bacteroidia bacterium]
MFSAFFWWTYSLIRYGESEKVMRMEILQTDSIHAAGETSHNMIHGRFVSDATMPFIYNGKTIETDTVALKNYVLTKFPNYDINFKAGQQLSKSFHIFIKPSVIKAEHEKFRRKKAKWISEGATMGIIMLVISIAMFLFLNRILTVNQQQNNFLLAVTHELKTPVASAKLAIETAAREIPEEKTNQKKLLALADKNLMRLGKMMDHVLMITRLESIQRPHSEQIIVLQDMVTEVMEDIKSSIPDSATIDMQFEPDLAITGDRDQLGMALSNLVSNAVKYSKPGEEKIQIHTYIEKGRVALSVGDQGIGIPVSEKRNIFRKFYRIGDENTRGSAGSGLGLYLVSKILRQHKAIIYVEDNIPSGSVFKIVFRNKV